MTPLPAALLHALGDGLHRLTLPDGRAAIAKRRRAAPAGFFAAEARGLAALRATSSLRVPTVFAHDEHGIVLEDLGQGAPGRDDWAHAGDALAQLHARRGERFGFDADGWCGDSAQDNAWDADGHRFLAERRLRPQALRAQATGLLSADDQARVEKLCARLPELLPICPPVLVHGDLWLGNLHACADGELALIDGGAVHYGWAAGDLAMLTLFGAPPTIFFEAYQGAAGIDASWREQAPLLNLYHLLNHLNLFGASYRDSVRAALRRFA